MQIAGVLFGGLAFLAFLKYCEIAGYGHIYVPPLSADTDTQTSAKP